MDYIKITTPENIEIEYRLAGVGSRVAAAVIDSLIQILIVAIIFLCAIGIVGKNILDVTSYTTNQNLNLVFLTLGIVILILFLIYYGYYVACEMLMNGQSIGKKIYGLRVIRNNGQPLTFTQSLSRNFFRYLIDVAFFGIVFIFFSKTKKRVGDMAAGTIVVDEGDKFALNPFSIESLTNEQHIPYHPLTTQELNVLKEYISRKRNFLDHGFELQDKIAELLYFKFKIQRDEVTDHLIVSIINENN